MVVHSAVVQSLIMSKEGGAWDKLEGYHDWEALVGALNKRAEEQEIPAVSAFQSCFVSMQSTIHDSVHIVNSRVGMRAENVVRVMHYQS